MAWGINLYGYCLNNSANYVDPYGLFRVDIWLIKKFGSYLGSKAAGIQFGNSFVEICSLIGKGSTPVGNGLFKHFCRYNCSISNHQRTETWTDCHSEAYCKDSQEYEWPEPYAE